MTDVHEPSLPPEPTSAIANFAIGVGIAFFAAAAFVLFVFAVPWIFSGGVDGVRCAPVVEGAK